jgi:hypothetical protein
MITGHHHDRVFQFARLLEQFERRGHVAIKPLYLEVVVGQVVANCLMVEQVGWPYDNAKPIPMLCEVAKSEESVFVKLLIGGESMIC